MATIWIEGFDEVPSEGVGTFLRKAGYIDGDDFQRVTGRGGRGYALEGSGGARVTRALPETPHVFTGFGFRPSANSGEVCRIANGLAAETVSIRWNAEDGLDIYFGGVLQASTAASVIRHQTWCYLEVGVEAGGAATTVRLRVNRALVRTASVAPLSAAPHRLSLVGDGARLDDWYIADDAGSVNNTFWGDVTVENVALSGAGDSTDFDPFGNTSNWRNANKPADANDTTYNVGSATGQQDLFHVKDVAPVADAIYAVLLQTRSRKIGSGAGRLATLLRDSTGTYIVGTVSPDASFRSDYALLDTQPSGDPWTVDAFSDIQIGYRRVV